MIDLEVYKLLFTITNQTFNLVDYLNLPYEVRYDLNEAAKKQYPKAF